MSIVKRMRAEQNSSKPSFLKRIGLKTIIPAAYFIIGLIHVLISITGLSYKLPTVYGTLRIPLFYFIFMIFSMPGNALLFIIGFPNTFLSVLLSAAVYCAIGWLLDKYFFQKNKKQ